MRLALAAVILAAACGDRPVRSPETPEPAPAPVPAVLRQIDAETPYLLVTLRPDADDRLMTSLVAMLRALVIADELPGTAPAVSGALRELVSDEPDRRSFERLGVDLSGPLTLSGLGLYPIMRASVGDEAVLVAALERIAAASSSTPSPLVADGPRRWRARLGDAALLVGVGAGQLGIALVPADLADALAPAVTGANPPADSIASAGVIDELARRRQLRDRIGFVDVVAATRAMFGPRPYAAAGAAIPPVVDSLGVPFPVACRRALVDHAQSVRRITYGVRASSPTRERVLLSLELDGAIGARLVAATSVIPGLDSPLARSADMVVGLGVRPGELLALLADGLDALIASPCGLEPELGAVRDQLRVTGAMLAPVVGVAVVMSGAETGEPSSADDGDDLDIAGAAAVLFDDADRFYKALASAGIPLTRGKTTRFPAPDGSSIFIYAGEQSAGVSIGLDAPGPVVELADVAAATGAATLGRIAIRGELAARAQRPESRAELEIFAPGVAAAMSTALSPTRFESLEIELRPERERLDVVFDFELKQP